MKAAVSILIVEDIKVISDYISNALSSRGYFVTTARSGCEAISVLEHSDVRFAGLITDIDLGPGPDGWDVGRLARAQNPHAFVIYTTGDSTEPRTSSAVPGGLVIRKPVTERSLMQAVSTLQNRGVDAPIFRETRSPEVEALYARLGRAEDDNRQLALTAASLASEHSASTQGASIALAEAREETKVSLADLLASASALAVSKAEAQIGQADLLASEVANRTLSLANDLLVANEADLERIVEQHIAALTREMEERRIAEDALRQGEKLRAIGQLTGGIAHDFNNILQIVFSTTAFLRSPELTHERRLELLDNLEEAAALAGQATSRLLAFARKKVLLPKSCDVNSLIKGMAELLTPTLGRNVSLQIDLAPDLSRIMADHGELEVAILNLASNARDAMLPGGGTFKLTTSAVSCEQTAERPAGDYVCLTASDIGPGMPNEVANHAFEPFFTTKPTGKGTGLGLAQVWGFAKQSGGDVAIDTSSEGTNITLYLPRPSTAAFEACLAAEADADSVAERTPALHRKTILVVEDNRDLSKLTTSLLQQIGYSTLSAENAREALDSFDGEIAIDAVFSDVVMPGDMNGAEWARTLQCLYPQLPVTLATGYSEYLVENPGPRAIEILRKPFRVGELTDAIGRSFARMELVA